jgi:GH15 family glucan-1,4-alpha-glucosidase
MPRSLDLALIGNGAIGLLLDAQGTIVWGCFPRFDGDATFCALLDDARPGEERGIYAVEIDGFARAEQSYCTNTAVGDPLHQSGGESRSPLPRLSSTPGLDGHAGRRVAGSPRVRVRLRLSAAYGRALPAVTVGSSHIRYVMPGVTLRLTTNASLTAILEERPFFLNDAVTLLLGPDETVQSAVDEVGRRFVEETIKYWRDWVRRLAIPFEWQAAVIRAAITLQQNQYDDTGAIVAAMTTSVPEAAGSSRNWDYRYCWLRDGYFVVDALPTQRHRGDGGLPRLILNIVASSKGLAPAVYRSTATALGEIEVASLPGYRGMGPVRVGNDAFRQVQHDVYGAAILAATHVFFDERLERRGDAALFDRLEPLGQRATEVFDQPDAGLWELRGRVAVHTFSSVMCWAACDRLARIGHHLGLAARAAHWLSEADRIARFIDEQCWSERRGSFVATAGGDTLDASLLRLAELNFVAASDPRFAATVEAIGRELKKGNFIVRYVERDDFGAPENAFVVCSFWYVDALAALGRRDEARALFLRLLGHRNRHGLLAEHLDTVSGEPWGNFVQTYSMVGLILSAIRLSRPGTKWSDGLGHRPPDRSTRRRQARSLKRRAISATSSRVSVRTRSRRTMSHNRAVASSSSIASVADASETPLTTGP